MRPQIRADRLWESLIDGMRDESYSYMRSNGFWEEILEKALTLPLGQKIH